MGVTTTGKADDDVARGADATAAATNTGVDSGACDNVVVSIDLAFFWSCRDTTHDDEAYRLGLI